MAFNRPLPHDIRAILDKQAPRARDRASAVWAMVQGETGRARILPDIGGSHADGSAHRGNADMTCMSCDKFDCTEIGPCEKYQYAPGSE